MARTRNGLSAQSAIEFTLTLTLFLVIVSCTAFFGYAAYQRAQINHALGTLATELPADWAQVPAKDLARRLILQGSDLDPAALTVDSATVDVDETVDVENDDPVATALGGQVGRSERHRVTVSADVSYRFEDAFLLSGQVTTHANTKRSYIAYTDYRVS